MKKILYTLFSLFVLASCTHNELDIPAPLQQESGEKVKLTFNVNIPEAQSVETRAFGESAKLNTLWLVLFDEFGYYVGKAQAKNATDNSSNTIGNVTMDNPDTEELDVTPFYVELNVTKSPRIIHFIGNYDLTDATLAGHENAIISRLNVTNGLDAYWQRINVAEIAKKDGAVADKTTGLFEGNLPDEMNPVHLLRNFAKITVEKATNVTNFDYTGFDIITTESHGSVAPYNVATDPASFPNFISDGNTCVSYQSLLVDDYTGFIPGASTHQNTFNKEANSFSATPSFSADPQYLYERNNADGQTYVIVQGKWNDNDDVTYYKIDLIREVEGSAVTYFHILRNFHYKIVIKSVEGAGADTPEEAAAGAASNNIFASVELQHLTNIGDGKARLFVNYTSKTLISNAPVTLEFNFLNERGVAENSRIKVQVGSADSQGSVIAQNSNGSYQVGTPMHGSSDVENTGYSYITIQPNTPGALPLKQNITLYDTETGLQRTIEYTLKQHYEFVNVTTSYTTAPSAVGDKFVYTFTLPADMPKSLFPMTFLVEAYPQTIYPDVDDANSDDQQDYASMPATTLEQSFGYERTVTWEDYDSNHSIVCGFKVNTPSPNYATVISVSHDLFKTGVATLGTTSTNGTFSNLTINGAASNATVAYGEGQDAIVTFDMNVVDATTLVKITAAGMASATSTTGFIEKNADGTFTYTPTRKAGKQTITFKTGNAVDNGSIKVESGETGDSKKYTNSLTANYTRELAWSGLAINGKSDGSAAIEYIGTSGNDAAITFYMPAIEDMNGNDITVTITATQFASSSTTGVTKENNGTFTYTPTKAGWQSVTLKTDGAVHGAGTVKLTASSGYTTALEVGFKNVLTLTSSNLKANKNTDSNDVTVYANSNYSGTALATGLSFAGSSPYTLNNGPKTIILSEGMTTLYFRYSTWFFGTTNHDAYATIAAIVSANGATLSFD